MQQLLFTPLPSPQSRWKSFVTGWGVQVFVVASLLTVNALFPQAIPQARHYVVTNLVPYAPPVLQEPQPANPRLLAKPQPVVEAPAVAKLVVPAPERKQPELEVKAPDVKIESKLPMLPSAPAPKVVATNTFSTGSSVMPTTAASAILTVFPPKKIAAELSTSARQDHSTCLPDQDTVTDWEEQLRAW